jgi:hypothetical protein
MLKMGMIMTRVPTGEIFYLFDLTVSKIKLIIHIHTYFFSMD